MQKYIYYLSNNIVNNLLSVYQVTSIFNLIKHVSDVIVPVI